MRGTAAVAVRLVRPSVKLPRKNHKLSIDFSRFRIKRLATEARKLAKDGAVQSPRGLPLPTTATKLATQRTTCARELINTSRVIAHAFVHRILPCKFTVSLNWSLSSRRDRAFNRLSLDTRPHLMDFHFPRSI